MNDQGQSSSTPHHAGARDDALPLDLEAALKAAYARLRDACHQARRVLLDGQPGRLPARWECHEEQRWLLDEIQQAEQDVDRLRLLATAVPAAAAARRAAGSARGMVLDGVARREREAGRLVGMRAG